MPTALLADIHGNLEALQAVLTDCRKVGVWEIVCLGDMIGYGPDPQAVLDCLREMQISCIMGNHELGVAFKAERDWFNPFSRKTLTLTESLLDSESLRFISTLPRIIAHQNFYGVHGFPPASVKTYLFEKSEKALRKWFRQDRHPLVFVGHTHDLEMAAWDGRNVVSTVRHQGVLDLVQQKYIVGVGSVGQPRDGDKCAKYAIWDEARKILETRFVAYDSTKTIAKMRIRGFPERYAQRLQ